MKTAPLTISFMKRKISEAHGDTEVIKFRIRRFWDAIECQPPCCPQGLLIETDDRRLLYLESWTILSPSDRLGEDAVAHRAVASNKLLAFETSGAEVSVEESSVRDLLLDVVGDECEWLDANTFTLPA